MPSNSRNAPADMSVPTSVGLDPRARDASEGKGLAPAADRQAVGAGCQSGWGAVTVGYKCH